MILEIAEIEIKAGTNAAFEEAVSKARPIFESAEGFQSLKLQHSIENPTKYRLMIEWNSVEDHTEKFQKSAGFQEWRGLVGDYFAQKPVVDHSNCVIG